MTIHVFGTKKSFKLTKVPEGLHHDVPVFEIEKNITHPDSYTFKEFPLDPNSGHVYQDEKNHAAFLIHPDEEGKLSVVSTTLSFWL